MNSVSPDNNLGHGFLVGKVAIVIMVVFIFSPNLCGGQVYFIQGQPRWDMPNKRPYPLVIYRLDTGTNSLVPVWSLEKNVKAWNIDVYSTEGMIVISEGDWFPQKVHFLTTENPSEARSVDISGLDQARRYKYLRAPGNMGYLELIHPKRGNGGRPHQEYDLIDIEQCAPVVLARDSLALEVRLAGSLPAYGSGVSDVLAVHLDSTGNILSRYAGFSFDGSLVPNTVKQLDSPRGWTLYANEAAFRVVASVPDQEGLTHREFLIQDRHTDKWCSILVEGADTSPRLINRWLVAVIADPDPETNYETHKGFPPILREDVVIIDPMACHQFKVHLGSEGEVLWIEDANVYYRVGESLFKARIENDDFVDRTLLLSDPVVKQIHWGFRGSSE